MESRYIWEDDAVRVMYGMMRRSRTVYGRFTSLRAVCVESAGKGGRVLAY